MKKILINGLSALDGGGITYLKNLFEFRDNKIPCKIWLLAPINLVSFFKTYENESTIIIFSEFASKNIFTRMFWEKTQLPRIIKKLDIDVYYAPGGTLSITPKNCINIVAFRNMIPFDKENTKKYKIGFMFFRIIILKYLFLKSFKKANKVIFISNYAQKIIADYLPNIFNKSEVIPHGVNPAFFRKDSDGDSPIDRKYYLYVSTLDIYKSQIELILAWKKLKEDYQFKSKLILVGSMYKPYGKKVLKTIKDYKMEEYVIYIGKIPYEELPKYYHHAEAIIYSSTSENCPNILLESLAAGKLIYCSSYQPMPEFAGNSVIYFNPLNVNDIVGVLSRNVSNQEKLSYENKAYEKSTKYSWSKTVSKTINYLIK